MTELPAEVALSGVFWTWVVPALVFAISFAATRAASAGSIPDFTRSSSRRACSALARTISLSTPRLAVAARDAAPSGSGPTSSSSSEDASSSSTVCSGIW